MTARSVEPSAASLQDPQRAGMQLMVDALRSQWPRLAASLLLASAALGSAVGLMATSAWLISAAALMPPILTLQVAIVGVRFFGITRGVVRYAERLVSHDAALRALSGLRIRVIERLVEQGPAAVPQRRQGEALSGIARDVDQAQDLAVRVLLPIASAAVVGIAASALAAAFAPTAGVVLLVALGIAGIAAPLLTMGAASGFERSAAGARVEVADVLTDLLAGASDLLVTNAVPGLQARLDEAEGHIARAASRRARREALGVAVVHGSLGLSVTALLVIAGGAADAGAMDPRAIAVLALLPLSLLEAGAALPAAALAWGRVRASAERLGTLLASPLRMPESACASEETPALQDSSLLMREVSAGWPGGADVLRGLDLAVAPGEVVAVTGPSGSGKSTLVAVLLRFLEHRGEVRVGGADLAVLPEPLLRREVVALPQEVHLFATSLRENLRIADPEAGDGRLIEALEGAGLGPWLATLPAGLDTHLGSSGRAVSGGEAVRLGLARVLVGQAQVVVLDEPSEHLDDTTARQVMDHVLDTAAGRRTVVLVSHRPFGIERARHRLRLH